MKLLVAMKSRQTVSQFAPEGHQVKQGTPTMGGLIILVGFLGGLPFVKSNVSLIPIAVLVFLFALIGFVDDFVVPRMMPGKRGLGWKQKILMQVVAAIGPLLLGGYTSASAIAIGTIAILFFANAYNFCDGLDGLSGTLLLGLLLGLYGLSHSWDLITLATPLLFLWLGAIIPFLYWNAPKAKVFMGDVGSLPIGAFLAGYWFLTVGQPDVIRDTAAGVKLLPVYQQIPITLLVAIVVWSLMMVAELVPVPLQIASVKLRKKKIFPYTPIHHAFEKAGWPETRVVFVFAICQLIFSMAAITIAALSK